MLIVLVSNTVLIAMDPPLVENQPQTQWWHQGKSGLCQLYRGIECRLPKDLESQIVSTILGDNQWWYCDFKVFQKEPLSRLSVALSDDGKLMAVAIRKNAKKFVELYSTTTGLQSACFNNDSHIYSMSFRDKLIVGSHDTVKVLDSGLNVKLTFDLISDASQDFQSIDFNSTMVVVKEEGRDISCYDIQSGKKLDFTFECSETDKIDLISLTGNKLVIASSALGGAHIYDLDTENEEILYSNKNFCTAINLKGSLLAMALNCGNVELHDINSAQKLMSFSPEIKRIHLVLLLTVNLWQSAYRAFLARLIFLENMKLIHWNKYN